MKRKRLLEWTAGAALLLTVLIAGGGGYFLKERQRRLDEALLVAMANMDGIRLQTAVRAGASVRVREEDGSTPLMVAVLTADDPALVLELLRRGTDVNAVDRDGHTALLFAAGQGHRESVKVLLAHGANPNVRDTDQGMTPLAVAADDPELVRLLKRAGAVQ